MEQFATYKPPGPKQAPYKRAQRLQAAAETGADGPDLARRIREAISVRQFVLRYVELSPAGVGLCPFHDDHHPSFSVDDKRERWKCFACDRGGSILDFYMELEGCDFKTAVADLADMLREPAPAVDLSTIEKAEAFDAATE